MVISDENLLIILPTGFLSKKYILENTTLVKKLSNKYLLEFRAHNKNIPTFTSINTKFIIVKWIKVFIKSLIPNIFYLFSLLGI